ncbi:MAG: glycerate kinase, partial [Bacillota bacterium]|nr:glycerate kinase [Bacillota bacterium]
MKKVIIAPGGCGKVLTSYDVASLIEISIRKVYPEVFIKKFMMADGGPGTIEAIVKAKGGKIFYEQVTGPLGEPVKGKFAILNDKEVGVVEVTKVSSLPQVQANKSPMYTTSYGTGELILTAIQQGCKTIYVGIGGAAINDGGTGMLQALGVRLLNANNEQIPLGAIGLKQLKTIDVSNVATNVKNTKFICLTDVNDVANEIVENQLGNAIKKDLNIGASGIAAGLMRVFNMQFVPGAQVIIDF